MDYANYGGKVAQTITHGAIRWDPWYGNTAGFNSLHTAATFSDVTPVDYRHLAPAHADLTNPTITWADSQSTFDHEINVAADGGLDYFAYLRYPTSSTGGMNVGYDYHLASSVGSRVGVTIIRQASDLGTTGDFADEVADTVTQMQNAKYFTQNGRPLLFIYIDEDDLATFWGSNFANLSAAVASIRANAILGGLQDPWIVTMGGGASRVNPSLVNADCCSNYFGALAVGLPSTYETFMNFNAADWDTYTDKMVPITMVGWDRRARVQHPEPWAEGATLIQYTETPTVPQFAAHLMQARAYVRANPTRCPLKTVLTYAWNECTEGGQMPCPTVGDPDGTLSRSFAMAKQAIY